MPTELDISLLEEDWGRTVRSLFLSSPDFNHQSHKDTHTHSQQSVCLPSWPSQAFTGFKIAPLYGQEEGCVWTGSSWEALETAVCTAQLRVKSHTQLYSQCTALQERDILLFST